MVGQKFKKCLKIDMKTTKFVNILSWCRCTKKKIGLITDKINLSRKRGTECPKAMNCENFCKVTSRFC